MIAVAPAADTTLLHLVAHEIRAPVAVIRGYLSLVRDGSAVDLNDAMRVMESKAEELEALAQVVIEAARLGSSDTPREVSTFDIADAIAEAVHGIQARARLQEAEVSVHAVAGHRWVTADRFHVNRILTNLLNNALSYTPAPAQIDVEVRDTSPVSVAVHDNGVGIAAEHQGRIFERFSRFADGGPNRPAGLGLGLSISRDLALVNGGELVLERSAPGKGSVFVLRLPVIS